MDATPTILTVSAVVLFVVGSFAFYKSENSVWSDGSKKVYRDEAESNILNWRTQTRNDFKGGKKKVTRKHYK
jgi:hypothetical protein